MPFSLPHPDPRLTRRGLLGGALGLGAAALVGCATSDGTPEAATSPSTAGPWSFTDDVGATIELDARPTRIAGLTDQVAALWNLGLAPVATFGMQSITDDGQFAGKDLSGVTQVGTSYGEIDLERLAALAPDLIVTQTYPDGKGGLNELLYGFTDEEQLAQVQEIAPVLTLAQRGKVDQVAARQNELARALGADPAALDEAEKEFSAAGDELARVAGSGVSMLSVAAYETDGVYVARAADDPALAYYTEDLGVTYPVVAKDIFYWHHLSWEKIDTYETDTVFASTRAMRTPALLKQPTFARLPAARAKQVFDKAFYPVDYSGQAQQMRAIAKVLAGARKVTPSR